MGLFDTVYVSADVAADWDLRCGVCGTPVLAEGEWQTKSLDPGMESYFLRHDDQGAVRLFLLDRPEDRRFWRPWTEEEILESERRATELGGLLSWWVKNRGEGTFLPAAYLPQNRRQRSMGELPHQWVEIYRACSCNLMDERWLKFCDGAVMEVRERALGVRTPSQPGQVTE